MRGFALQRRERIFDTDGWADAVLKQAGCTRQGGYDGENGWFSLIGDVSGGAAIFMRVDESAGA
jgi:hypothetical protein